MKLLLFLIHAVTHIRTCTGTYYIHLHTDLCTQIGVSMQTDMLSYSEVHNKCARVRPHTESIDS